MIRFYTTATALLLSLGAFAQQPFKNIPASTTTNVQADQLDFRKDLIPRGNTTTMPALRYDRVTPLQLGLAGVEVLRDSETGAVYALRGRPGILSPASDKAAAWAYLKAVGQELGIDNPTQELVLSDVQTDANGQVHYRLTQQFSGVPVYPAEARLHATGDHGFDLLTGRLSPTPTGLNVSPLHNEDWARTQVRSKLEERWTELPAEKLAWISGPQLEAELIVYAPAGQSPTLAWRIEARPNLLEHQISILEDQSGEILEEYSHLCGLHNNAHGHNGAASPASSTLTSGGASPERRSTSDRALPPPPDGAYTTTQLNLYDQNETINTFVLQDTFYLLDGTRDMFTTAGGNIDGFLLTYDGFGGSPQRQDFNPGIAISLTNEDWSKTAVSVHANAGVAYQYFFDRFNRNSIDGNGGNVISFLNINETDGTQMDNAFWNGRALFYGNGVQAFNRLPRALDVAGHEMAHGVIQSTADLIYQDQPGAMNESFADIFGYLVEGETGDYRIGEDVVRTNVFTSGAMRNLQNPNNGAAGPSDFRWQPAHMDEYQNLSLDEDNGGVHINSGIPNRAFYLFSSDPAVGDARAEQVYYRALNVYLTRSSRFEDLRLAVVQAADDLYGSDVVAAANAAFDGVGIGSMDSEGGDYTVDLESNEGDRFVLVADTPQEALYRTEENGTNLVGPLVETGILSRPSITDDGAVAVFVDDQNRVRVYNFAAAELSFLETNPQTIWRNVAVSKDGNRLALTTTDNDNQVLIFDLVSGSGRNFELYNPTTANGISTGDVQYADALEWDPRGDFLLYDALSQIDEELEYWDIGLLRAWDTDAADFGDGIVLKLSNSLPEGISIGNPTFSKNSPYIIAFEEVDFDAGTYKLQGANIETGATATIFTNGRINYPSFGIDDDRVCFDAVDTEDNPILAVRGLAADKISPSGNPAILIEGGHWGQYFATGQRDLDTAIDGPIVEDERVRVYPTVTEDLLTIEVPLPVMGADLQVFDANGRLVLARTLVRGEVSLGALSAGAYFVAVPVDGGVVVRRVIVR